MAKRGASWKTVEIAEGITFNQWVADSNPARLTTEFQDLSVITQCLKPVRGSQIVMFCDERQCPVMRKTFSKLTQRFFVFYLGKATV